MVEVQELSDWVGVICLLGLQELYAGDVHTYRNLSNRNLGICLQ
jgi:hypothetical protein